MTILQTLVAAAAGAASATVGVVVGGVVTRRGQDRHWLRDKQLDAYADMLRHYAQFTMEIKRAHADRRGWDYDWGEWSSALVTASLVAPVDVALEIGHFGKAIDSFLERVARNADTISHPVTAEEFDQASEAPAQAQVALVNAIRRSLGNERGALPEGLGGSLGRRPGDHQNQLSPGPQR
jgi:hypothetical protein